MISNPDRPIPKANTGSAFSNWLANTSTSLVHLERRFDPFFRPAFDGLLRDRIATLVTALINKGRPNEGLRIAEEKLLPNEEAYLDSIIASFEKQMRLLWKPGRFERGGNTKTHGIVRAEFIVHDNLPAEAAARHLCGAAHLSRHGCASPGRVLILRPISTTSGS